MKSMTGFGRSSNRIVSGAKSKAPSVEIDVSVKAVNGRYLDIRFHLPREYAGLESEFRSILTEKCSRGTLDVYVNRFRKAEGAEVRVNAALARSWLESYRELGKTLKLSASEPSLDWFTRLPEIFAIDDRHEVNESEKKLARKLLGEAAHACDLERLREGKALESELSELLAKLEKIAANAEDLKGEAKAELEGRILNRLREQLQKLGVEGKIDDQRLAQEIVISIDKTDISEELSRLRAHLKAYRQLLKSQVSEGKKLDFYAQELLREINTIGSKSHIAQLTGLVVEAKTCVEKIREQVQNVE